MDRVQAASVHLEAGGSTELLDHQVAAGGQHVSQAVAIRRVAVTVRGGRQGHCVTGQAYVGTTAQGACLRIDQTDLCTSNVESGTDAATTLNEQRIHIEPGRYTELDDIKVKRVGVVDQGMHREVAHHRQ